MVGEPREDLGNFITIRKLLAEIITGREHSTGSLRVRATLFGVLELKINVQLVQELEKWPLHNLSSHLLSAF